jgi:hypothetical protein
LISGPHGSDANFQTPFNGLLVCHALSILCQRFELMGGCNCRHEPNQADQQRHAEISKQTEHGVQSMAQLCAIQAG